MSFRDLPAHPQVDDDHQQWLDWMNSASPSELLEALMCRMNHLSRMSLPDLEPTSRLLYSRLQEHLQPQEQPQESEVV